MKTSTKIISLGTTILVSGTLVFLGVTEPGRSILKKNPKLCAWMEKKEKEREERRKRREAERIEAERQRAIREEQRKEEQRLKNLYNYHYNQYFSMLRHNWPLRVDPEVSILDIPEFDMSIKGALYGHGIYHVSGLLYHYLERRWYDGNRFTDINDIGIKRNATIMYFIQSNAWNWNRLNNYRTDDMDRCAQTFYDYKRRETGTYSWR